MQTIIKTICFTYFQMKVKLKLKSHVHTAKRQPRSDLFLTRSLTGCLLTFQWKHFDPFFSQTKAKSQSSDDSENPMVQKFTFNMNTVFEGLS